MSITDELKPCPFCGNRNIEVSTDIDEFVTEWGESGYGQEEMLEIMRKRPYYFVGCSVIRGGCGASSGFDMTREGAVARWNRRTE